MRELSVARFTFSSDRAVAEEMMAGFEWIIKSAMEQAELAQHADQLTVDPAVEQHLLMVQSRKGAPPSSGVGHYGCLRGASDRTTETEGQPAIELA